MDWSIAIFGPAPQEPASHASDGVWRVATGDVQQEATAKTLTNKSLSGVLPPLAGRAAEWVASHEVLLRTPCPAGWSSHEWGQLQDDIREFLSAWSTRAIGLTWSELDLFGVHRAAPRTRYDVMGLVPLLAGRRVVALDEAAAVIRGPSGRNLTFYRGFDNARVAESVSAFVYGHAIPMVGRNALTM